MGQQAFPRWENGPFRGAALVVAHWQWRSFVSRKGAGDQLGPYLLT